MAPDDPPPPEVVGGAVPGPVRAEVLGLADAAQAADGTRPLSEDAELALRSADAVHLLLRGPDAALAGYAQLLAAGDGVAGGEAVVHPAHRHRGLGRALVTAAARAPAAHPGGVALWSHGDHPDARDLAADLGWSRTRTLWQMRRRLDGPDRLPSARPPEGVRLRPFRPGHDDAAWLATNAAAFADHPEQGRWTRQDLDARLREPWFDATGFLLAEDADGDLLGFHWTKTHPGGDGEPATGEVYVLGVAPRAQGRGVGRALTLAGLAHLAGRGLGEVLLYVEADNTAAVRTYRSLGFEVAASDVQYTSPPADTSPPG